MSSHELLSQPSNSGPELADWQDAVVYQMYLKSWLDTTGNGKGDLQGAINRLDILEELGANVIWLNPIYPSPGKDGGYDIADYTDIDAEYGGLEKFQLLLDEAHQRGIRVIMDFVPNHCSDQHEWFQASRDVYHPQYTRYRDYFIWSDGKGNSPPNNMLSVFPVQTYDETGKEWKMEKRSAWTWDAGREQYYYHSFSSAQPDLNWENRSVREAMLNNVRFWMDMGVDGLRFDAINYLGKDPRLASNPKCLNEERNAKYIQGSHNPYDQLQRQLSANGKRMYDHLGAIADVIASYSPNRFMFTEAAVDSGPTSRANIYQRFHAIRPNVVTPFNLMLVDDGPKASMCQKFFDTYMRGLESPAVLPVGNHDKPRLVTQLGRLRALGMAMIQFSLPNTMPVIYYGEELGLPNVHIPPDQVEDTHHLRDGARTPYLFSNAPNAGATTGTPWLPIHENFTELSQETQSSQQDSVWNFYRVLSRMTKQFRRGGKYRVVYPNNPDVFAFKNEGKHHNYYTFSNMSDQAATVTAYEESNRQGKGFRASRAYGHVLLSNYQNTRNTDSTSYDNLCRLKDLVLQPEETVIIRQLSGWHYLRKWFQQRQNQTAVPSLAPAGLESRH